MLFLHNQGTKSLTRNSLFSTLSRSFLGKKMLPFLVRANEDAVSFNKIRLATIVISYVIYLYVQMLYTTSNFKTSETHGFLGTNHFIDFFFYTDFENPVNILTSPSVYINFLIFILYFSYSIIVLFFANRLARPFLKVYIAVLSDVIASVFLFIGMTNAGIALYSLCEVDTQISYINLLYIVPFVLSIPGLLIAICYGAFTIRKDYIYSTVSPVRYIEYCLITAYSSTLKI